MNIKWSSEARNDVDRLADFLAVRDPILADEVEHVLEQAPRRLLDFPRRGSRLSEFDSREVRELRVGRYVFRYEIVGADIYALRFFHAREDRL